MLLTTLSYLGTLNPISLARFNKLECSFIVKSFETIEYKKHSNGLLATSLESRSLILPEAVFLGFMNKDSPFSSRFLFSALNDSVSIIISPLISNFLGKNYKYVYIKTKSLDSYAINLKSFTIFVIKKSKKSKINISYDNQFRNIRKVCQVENYKAKLNVDDGEAEILIAGTKVSKIKNDTSSKNPVKFIETFFFQFINPKSVIVSIIMVSTYVEKGENFINYSLWVISVAFFFACFSIMFWTLVGKFLSKFATNEKFIKGFNYAMSLLLISCIATFYL